MTYLQFHLYFNLPVLVLLLFLARHRLKWEACKWIFVVTAIVMVTTTPWDNWAVYREIWSFDWARTTPVEIPAFGVLWRLPAEEYAFFIIETWMVGLLTLLFLPLPERWRKN